MKITNTNTMSSQVLYAVAHGGVREIEKSRVGGFRWED